MQNITSSGWFALITGIASVFGAIIALYSFRVRLSKSSDLKRMEWEKSILISVSIGMIVFTFINFYNQKPPPKDKIFRAAYNYLHGKEFPWAEDIYYYSAKVERSGYLIEINRIEVTEYITRIHFLVRPQLNKNFSEGFEPFPRPILALGFALMPRFHLMNKDYLSPYQGLMPGYLDFPSLKNKTGDLYFWADVEIDKKLTSENATFIFSAPDPQGDGVMVWGVLFIISLALFIWGITRNPTKSFKNKLLEEGEEIIREKNRMLDEILNSRTYSELSFNEKRRYRDVSQHYRKAQDVLLEVLTGYLEKPSKNNK